MNCHDKAQIYHLLCVNLKELGSIQHYEGLPTSSKKNEESRLWSLFFICCHIYITTQCLNDIFFSFYHHSSNTSIFSVSSLEFYKEFSTTQYFLLLLYLVILILELRLSPMKSVMNLPTKRNKSNFKAGLGMLKFDHITITRVYISRDFISYRGDRSYLAYICAKNLKFCDRS